MTSVFTSLVLDRLACFCLCSWTHWKIEKLWFLFTGWQKTAKWMTTCCNAFLTKSIVRRNHQRRSVKDMVEKWDLVLGPRISRRSETPWTPGTSRTLATPSTSGSHGPPGLPGLLNPWTPWDLRTSWPLGNYLYRLKNRIETPRNFETEA